MKKILCATRGGEASYRTQDAVIDKAKSEGATIIFLYVADIEFLKQSSRGARPDLVQQEMDRMGEFLLAMAVERAAKQGVEAESFCRHGDLFQALKEVALEEEVALIAFGRPAQEGVFQMSGLEKLVQKLEEETGVKADII